MKKKEKKKREPAWMKLLLAVVTLLQVALSVLLHVMRRRETLRVIKNDDTITVLALRETETEAEK